MQPAFSEFNLAAEIAKLVQRKPWPSGTQSAVLLKTSDMRVLLVAMEQSARMKEHHAEGTVSVHVLRGSLRLHLQDKVATLAAGHLLTIPPAVKHDVEALEESAFLLTISWPHGG